MPTQHSQVAVATVSTRLLSPLLGAMLSHLPKQQVQEMMVSPMALMMLRSILWMQKVMRGRKKKMIKAGHLVDVNKEIERRDLVASKLESKR